MLEKFINNEVFEKLDNLFNGEAIQVDIDENTIFDNLESPNELKFIKDKGNHFRNNLNFFINNLCIGIWLSIFKRVLTNNLFYIKINGSPMPVKDLRNFRNSIIFFSKISNLFFFIVW